MDTAFEKISRELFSTSNATNVTTHSSVSAWRARLLASLSYLYESIFTALRLLFAYDARYELEKSYQQYQEKLAKAQTNDEKQQIELDAIEDLLTSYYIVQSSQSAGSPSWLVTTAYSRFIANLQKLVQDQLKETTDFCGFLHNQRLYYRRQNRWIEFIRTKNAEASARFKIFLEFYRNIFTRSDDTTGRRFRRFLEIYLQFNEQIDKIVKLANERASKSQSAPSSPVSRPDGCFTNSAGTAAPDNIPVMSFTQPSYRSRSKSAPTNPSSVLIKQIVELIDNTKLTAETVEKSYRTISTAKTLDFSD